MREVPATEFTRRFGEYRDLAQREPVAVTSHGRTMGYFVSPVEFAEFTRYREARRSFAVAELPEAKIKAIGASRMDPAHDHLNALLDET